MYKFLILKPLEDSEQNRIAQALNTVVIVTVIGLFIIIIERILSLQFRLIPVLSLVIIVMFYSIYLLRKEKVYKSSVIVVWTLLLNLNYLAITGLALRDSAIFGFPGVIVIAALVLRKKYYFYLVATLFLSIGLIGFCDINGFLPQMHVRAKNYNDIVDLIIIFGITAIIIGLIADHLLKSLNSARENEMAIRVIEKRQRALLAALPDLVLRMDKNGNILGVSAPNDVNIYEEFGEILDKNLCEIVTSHVSDQLIKIINQALIHRKISVFEFPLKLRNGVVEFEARVIALNNEEVTVVLRDITEKIKKEIEIRIQDAKFKSLVASIQDLVYTLDKEQNVIGIYGQWSEMYGFTEEKMKGKKFSDFLTPSEKEVNDAACNKALNGEAVKYEWHLKKDQNDSFYFESSLTPYYDLNHELIGIVGVAREITEHKKTEKILLAAQKQAEEANKIKSSLLSNMSHEFRTPLNGILGFAEILGEELAGSTLVEMTNKIHKSGKRLLNTLNSILTVVELDNSEYLLNNTIVGINSFCEKIKNEFSDCAYEKNLTLKFKQCESLKIIEIDEHILSQIISLLVDNAIKYTDIGEVEIEAKHFKNELGEEEFQFIVSDTGIGIKPEDQKIIFAEFKQVSEGYSRTHEGMGLGLSLAHKMTKLLGAKLKVESVFGEGSKFILSIPQIYFKGFDSKNNSNDQAKITAVEMDQSNLIFREALIVEDNLLNAEVIQRYIAPVCKSDIAVDGDSALKMISSKQYDLLLLDINLGDGMDGTELLAKIKENDKYKATPSIALTGYASSGSKNFFLSKGFSSYLAKPFNKNSLLNMVNKLNLNTISQNQTV